MPRFTLKTKITLLLPLAMTVALAALLFLAYSLVQSHIKETIFNQQYQMVSILADEIDRNVASSGDTLQDISRKITRAMVNNPEQALAYLRQQDEHLKNFDNGLFLFDRHGRMVAELPLELQRVGKDFQFREYLAKTIASRRPFLSDPYISSQAHHHPAVMFTVPVFDNDGSLMAVVGGSVDLARESFLGRLANVKFGKKGYPFLFNSERLMLLHPDKSRVMKKDVPPGVNKLLDRAVAGFDGTGETVNSRGMHALASFKHLKTKNWILGANFPVAEAFAPISRLRNILLTVLPILTIALFCFMRRYLGQLTEPVVRLTRHVESLSANKVDQRTIPVEGSDEIAILGHSFNHLVAEIDRQRDELVRREVLYRTVVDFSSETIFLISPDRRTLSYISPSCLELTGYAPEEFQANPGLLSEMIHSNDRDHWDEHCRLEGGCDFSEPLEFRLLTRQGETRWVNHLCRPVYDHLEQYAGIRGSFSDISLWKQAESAIVASEEKFRIFFEESGDAIFIVGVDGLIKEANNEASQRYGYSHQELVNMPVPELDTPEESVHIPERVARIMEQGQYTFETVHRRKHDSPMMVEVSASLIDYEGNRAILAVVRDITARKQAEQRLHRQNEYLQALHETTVGLLSRHDVAGLLQAIVTRAGNLIGTEHCYVYLKNSSGIEMEMVFQSGVYNSFVHHPIKPGQGIAGRVWESMEPVHVADYSCWEGRLPDPDRDCLHAMAGVPLTSGGEVIGALGLAFIDCETVISAEQMDLLCHFGELASLALENARLNDKFRRELSERKKAEEHLHKLSVAVEQNPASIIITDPRGVIEYVNPHFSRLTGYLPEEAIGRTPSILRSGETSTGEYRQLWETILSGGEWRGEFHNRKKNGELYWEQALIAPIRDENGAITHFIGIKEDITDRKQLESQLRHSQKMEAIGQLAGGIAHDFNNILTAIIGYSSIMQLKLPDDSPFKKSAGQIIETAERGASLTQGLLAFSRKQVTYPVAIDLNEILARVQQLLRRLISEDIGLDINPSAQGLPVMADSGQIEQVLMNLATNARDAMPNGGSIVIATEMVTLDSDFVISMGFGQAGDYALLTFTDSGEGMDEETARHIFEPFYTTKDLGKGTGLGLSIVYGIVKKHNGYITCHSTIGLGTVMQVYLPLLTGSPAPVVLAPEEGAPVRQGSDLVLVAEDNEAARTLAKEILEEFGYSVLEAGDGQEALELFRDNRDSISLVILDVIMPKLNGREVYDAIRAIDPAVRVLFCSGYPEDVVIKQGGFESGMNYLAKPYSPKELLMKIREVLDNAH